MKRRNNIGDVSLQEMVVEPVVRAFEAYLAGAAGIAVSAAPQLIEGLPVFMRQRYAFCRVRVAGQDAGVGIVVRDPQALTPAAFEKHLRDLPADVQRRYVVIAEDFPSYVRVRLIERRIPFVVPGAQANWPELGVFIRARRDRKPFAAGPRLSPAAQAAVVAALAGILPRDFAAHDGAQMLGYARMTMTRVFDELDAVGLATPRRQGHERRLTFNHVGCALWDAARSRLRDPLRKTVFIRTKDVAGLRAPIAGESALAETTMLAAPSTPVCAIGPEGWARLRASGAEPLPIVDSDACALQLWMYEPSVAARDGRVDPFSLALTLAHVDDERVAMAVDEVLANALRG